MGQTDMCNVAFISPQIFFGIGFLPCDALKSQR